MKTVTKFLAILAVAGMMTTVADAALFISTWPGGTQNLTVTLDVGGNNIVKTGGVGRFVGELNGANIGRVWCVDIMNYAGYEQWNVNVYQDGTSWNSNDPGFNGEDKYRVGDWKTVAWLINNYGTAADVDLGHTVALHAAIYKYAYGSNFVSVSGLTDDPSTDDDQLGWYNQYVSAADGQTSDRWWFYDNDQTGTNYQDYGREIPEPSSLLLLGGALAGGALAFKRRLSV